ncbi:MAG: hypothetical protein U5S82_23645 [Gammaproteobacteria bacterium]|nr:hypothetical protein [Gammaproteobacteria bacterium]
MPVTISDVGTVALGPAMQRGQGKLDDQGVTVGGIVVMRYGENALATRRALRRDQGAHGRDDDCDSHGRLPASVQAGSGSWDYFGGIVMTHQTLRYQMDRQITYRENTVADDFEAGDVWRLDGSLEYRLNPLEIAGGVPAFIYGALEVNLIHEGRNRIDGRRDPDSGGTRLFLTPGPQYVGRRWILEGALQVPVVQDLNGGALETDYILRADARLNF